jgi:hypothetical protein
MKIYKNNKHYRLSNNNKNNNNKNKMDLSWIIKVIKTNISLKILVISKKIYNKKTSLMYLNHKMLKK